MKHENESVDARLVMRVFCGLMATIALPVGLIGVAKYGVAENWFEALFRLSLLLGVWLSGYVAFTGRLPLEATLESRLARDEHRKRGE